jgi:RND family efflux transporter MFP subunit
VITAQTSGVVQIGNNELVAGRSVSAGQALLTIDAGGMSDNNLSVRLAEVESEYERARAEYERKAQLAEDQIVSQSDLESARRAFSSAEAQYNHLQRNFRAGRQTVSSPISGFITNMLVYNGQFAEAGQPLLTVSQNKDLFLRADISPHYYEHLLHVTSATLRIPGKERSFTLEELGGELVSFGKSIDVENPLIPVVFQIENRAGLLPGSFLDIYIQTQTSDEALTVANEAVVEEMGNYFVFVQLTPEYFEKRHVKIGKSNGIRTEISEGITEGERVVSKGALLVKLAQTAGALDAHSGHVH